MPSYFYLYMSNNQTIPNDIAEIVNTICNTINSSTTAHYEVPNVIDKIIRSVDILITTIKLVPEDTILPMLINSVEECITLSIAESLGKRNGFGKFFTAYWIFAKRISKLDNSLDIALSRNSITVPIVMELVWCMSLVYTCHAQQGNMIGFDSVKTNYLDTIEHILNTYDTPQLNHFTDTLRLAKYDLVIKLCVITIANTCRTNLANGRRPVTLSVVENTDWTTKPVSSKKLNNETLKEIHKAIESCENNITKLKTLVNQLVGK